MEKILEKSGLTEAQIDTALEGQVLRGCLILRKDRYDEKAFYERKDIKYVVAKNLAVVSKLMFCLCFNLDLIYAPNVERIEDGFVDEKDTV